MLRTFAGVTAGAILVLAGFFAVLLLTPPAHAAQCGKASWYGPESGSRTASGAFFDGSQMIVAHRTLKLGTKLRLTYRGRSVVAVVLDRGPAKWTGRDIDLSRAVAAKLGMLKAGIGRVCFQKVG